MTVISWDVGTFSARFALERERTRRRLREMSSHFSTPALWGEGGHAVRQQNLNPSFLSSGVPFSSLLFLFLAKLQFVICYKRLL